MKLYTIGFTKTNAESFFGRLTKSGARKLVDVRLNNVSQLAGFAKKDDLRFFLSSICHMDYVHRPLLAPTQDMLNDYRKNGDDWSVYEKRFLNLMAERHIEDKIAPDELDGACLLCSEDKPHHCHRWLVAEYLKQRWGGLEIVHL